jgi:hypothetical protein
MGLKKENGKCRKTVAGEILKCDRNTVKKKNCT